MTENEPLDPEAAAKERAREIAAAYIRAAGVDVTKQATWAAPAAEAAPASEAAASAAAAAPAADAQAAVALQATAQAAAQQATAPAQAATAQAVAAQAAAAPAQAAAAQVATAQATAPAQAIADQATAPAAAAPVAAQAAAPVAATAAMPPVEAPVYTSAPAAAPAQAAPDAFAQQPLAPVQEEKKGGAGRIIAIIALILGILIVLGIVVFLFFPGILPFGASTNEDPAPVEEVQVPVLSEVAVITAFDEADMQPPDLAMFAYVSQDPLIGPQFGDVVLNEVTNTSVAAGQPIECTATATATFKNKGIEIAVPVTLPFEFSAETGTWTPGELVSGDAIGAPLASPNASEILENLNDILQANDPTYAEEMSEAEITKTTSDLTIDGGTIGVDLSKTVVEEDEKAKRTVLNTSSVTLAVAWSATEGWIVSVSNTGEINKETIKTEGKIDDQAVGQDEQTATLSPSNENQEPQSVGTAHYGDSITLSGTLQAVENTGSLASGNNYKNADATETADGAVRLVLVLKRPIDITLNGTSYRLTSVALALGDNISDSQVRGLYGDTGSVSGTIDEGFATNWSPVGLKVSSVEVNR